MRSEGGAIDSALDEVFRIASEAKIPAEIWHLKVAGRLNWGRMPHVIARIDSARGAGLDVTADLYPYVAGATSLDASIPAWAHSGGVAPDGPFGRDGAHPRAYGSFARILGHYVRDEKLMPLEFAVRKATSLPAQRVGLTGRGLLKPGFFADITVFDPATIIDRATFENPHQPSAGIAYVFVNGQKVLDHGKVTRARPGRGLRGPGYVPRTRRGE